MSSSPEVPGFPPRSTTGTPVLTPLEAKILLMDLDAIPRGDDWDFNIWKAAVAKLAVIAGAA